MAEDYQNHLHHHNSTSGVGVIKTPVTEGINLYVNPTQSKCDSTDGFDNPGGRNYPWERGNHEEDNIITTAAAKAQLDNFLPVFTNQSSPQVLGDDGHGQNWRWTTGSPDLNDHQQQQSRTPKSSCQKQQATSSSSNGKEWYGMVCMCQTCTCPSSLELVKNVSLLNFSVFLFPILKEMRFIGNRLRVKHS